MSSPPSWSDAVETLTEKLMLENLPQQVKSAKSLEDKVGKVLDNLSVAKRISSWLSVCGETKYRKCGGTASKLRDQGNIKFGARDTVGALKLYTESVICAPELGPELGLAFGNRSAALFHLGNYNASCTDIQLALQHKFPKQSEYKLYLRMSQCFIRLAQYKHAMKALGDCKLAIDYSKLAEDKKSAVRRDISALEKEALKLESESLVVSETSSILEFENRDFPGASDKLQLKYSNDKVRGRYVVAKDHIQTGEIIFSETPYSWVLLPSFYSTHCSQCLAQLVAPVPCRLCTQARYCSGECRDKSWSSYHQYECGHLDLLHSVGIGHLALRTILMAGKDFLMSIKASVRSGSYGVNDSYSKVFNLQHHIDRLPVEELFQYSLTAALLVTLLNRNTAFLSPERAVPGIPGHLKPVRPGMEVEDNVLHYMGGLLLKHLAQLIGNAHAVTELLEGEDGEVEQVRLATAIYPSASMMNHSCIPKIINSFVGAKLVVRTIKNVVIGEEVTNCYGPHYRRHTYRERQEMLSSQYNFKCLCHACRDPQERLYLDRFTALQCKNCKGAVVSNECQDCGGLMEEKHEDIESLINKIDLDPNVDLDTMKKAEKQLSETVYKQHSSLARLRDRMARAEVERGEYSAAAALLKQTVETTAARFGSDSVEFGHELLKLTDVLTVIHEQAGTAVKKVNIVDGLKMAANIFGLHYGTNCKQFKEIEEKLCYYEVPSN